MNEFAYALVDTRWRSHYIDEVFGTLHLNFTIHLKVVTASVSLALTLANWQLINLNILGVKFKKLSLQNGKIVYIRTNVRVKKASEVKSEVIMTLNSWSTQMNIFHSEYSKNSLFVSLAPSVGNIDGIMHLKTVTSADTHLIWLTRITSY